MHLYPTRPRKGSTLTQDWWPKPIAAQDEVPSLEDPDIRADLVHRVRREIAEGTYDTPAKFEMALDRLLREIR
jgi:hypothetical protein